MVTMRQQVQPGTAHGTHRTARKERMERIRRANEIPSVRVEPTNEEYRAVLRHPRALPFRDTGSIEWPMDRFTQRRIADGSVKVVEDAEPSKNHHRRRGHESEQQPEGEEPASTEH